MNNRIRYFVAVAEARHFGRAAEKLHMSQPPLSQQIQLLEKQLGIQLLTRTTRRVELTEAGQQGLMVNRMAAAWACAMLHDFLVARSQAYFALAFELKWGGTRAWAIDAPTLAEVAGLTIAQLKTPKPTSSRRQR